MSFGSKASSPPPAQPVTPVPQPDDPKGLEEQRRAAQARSKQGGYAAHLLTGENGVTEDVGNESEQAKLKPM